MNLSNNTILLLVLLLAGTGSFIWFFSVRKRLQMTWWAALCITVLSILSGVFCVRVFARLEGADAGSLSIFGAVFFMPVFFYIGAKLFKRPVKEVFDAFTIPMIFTLFCTRINCLATGCCYGRFIGETQYRWPTREAEMLVYIVFLAIVAPKVLKGKTHGEVYPLYMVTYGIARAIIECFRYSASAHGVFHLSHLWAALSFIIGLPLLGEIMERARKQDEASGPVKKKKEKRKKLKE